MEDKFLKFIADIMEVEPQEISMNTEYNNFTKWDSLMMLTLIMEIESEYDVNIPMEKVEKIKKLEDLYTLINE